MTDRFIAWRRSMRDPGNGVLLAANGRLRTTRRLPTSAAPLALRLGLFLFCFPTSLLKKNPFFRTSPSSFSSGKRGRLGFQQALRVSHPNHKGKFAICDGSPVTRRHTMKRDGQVMFDVYVRALLRNWVVMPESELCACSSLLVNYHLKRR